jgi:hypothetical protein
MKMMRTILLIELAYFLVDKSSLIEQLLIAAHLKKY